MKKLVIAYHGYLNEDYWKSMIDEQFTKLISSELLDNCHKLHIGVVNNLLPEISPNAEWVTEWFQQSQYSAKVDFIVYPRNDEITDTLKWVKDYSKDNPGEYILFFHSKGMSHNWNQPQEDWRRYMEYFVIENWRDCIQKLDEGFDCCGVMWTTDTFMGYFPHFSGAFWWATTDYINTLNPKYLENEPEWGIRTRLYREFWIGSNSNVKAFEFHNSGLNTTRCAGHYTICYDRSNYCKK